MVRITRIFLVAALLAAASCSRPPPPSHTGSIQAKNIILFIGDGMGMSTVTAARIFDGQSKGLAGEEHELAFERFPQVALVKTYNTNQQVPDSAGTVTAMLTGEKSRAGVINVASDVPRRDCDAALENPLTSLGQIAAARGLSVGFVTTTRVTHATPAGLYAHSPEREWEVDTLVPKPELEKGCRDMAWQLVNSDLDVAMGGASKYFFGSGRGGARRNADEDLVREWLAGGAKRRYIVSAEQLAKLNPGDQVLGLFAPSHMTYTAQRAETTTEPTLSQMTAAAIDVMAGGENGYFLMVEGGRIDHAHHDGRPGWAMLEAQEFNRAVEVVLDKVDIDKTLILVTADHSHVFTMGGYATRGNPILGYVVKNDSSGDPRPGPDIAADGQPYTTLAYANGPGAVRELPRPRPDTGIDMVAQSLVPFAVRNVDGTVTNDETHAGEDVALYATGPGSEGVGGVIEQNRIFDIMMGALGWED